MHNTPKIVKKRLFSKHLDLFNFTSKITRPSNYYVSCGRTAEHMDGGAISGNSLPCHANLLSSNAGSQQACYIS
jgi:hypothetical protein